MWYVTPSIELQVTDDCTMKVPHPSLLLAVANNESQQQALARK
jgi:hypothetical protein